MVSKSIGIWMVLFIQNFKNLMENSKSFKKWDLSASSSNLFKTNFIIKIKKQDV
jgi:hypothetical protein